jgi:hypothetical protein
VRTQVVIAGAGPAGLLLGQILYHYGVDNVILERRDADYVLARIRAGVLEQGTVDILKSIGVADRLVAEGLAHDGIEIAFGGARHRINMRQATGRHVTIYGQTEVTRDLMTARAAARLVTVYGATDVHPNGFDGTSPSVLTLGMAQPTRSTAISSRAATDSMASAAKASPRPPVANSSDYIRSAGSVSSRKHLRSAMNSSMPVTNEDSHYARCAPKREAAIMFNVRSMTMSISGPMRDFGTNSNGGLTTRRWRLW